MAFNYASQTTAGRFSGLGAALLDQFSTNGSDFSQSVQQGTPGTQANMSGGAVSGVPAIVPGAGDDQATFSVTTKSGVKVTLALDNGQDGLAVQVKSSGKLSDAERSALDQLAKGFQDALDGMTANPPQVKLDGLTQFDPTVLASVDLDANIKTTSGSPQSLDFHADAAQRTLSYTGAAGTANVSVDLSDTASLGSPDQQAKAIANYLQQFDQADTRGNGDGSLMTIFKDAFSQMNSHYPTTSPQAVGSVAPPPALKDQDHAMLTGLADFSASVTQTTASPNPRLPNETDTFAYQVSQSTVITNPYQFDRSISQSQQSSLKASYHASLSAGTPLMLDKTLASQNYYYDQIDDTASSATDMAYNDKGILTKASLNQSASQSMRIEKYVGGQLTDDTTTPAQASLTRDLVATLTPKRKTNQTETALEVFQRQQQLSAIHDSIFLQVDPGTLSQENQAQTGTLARAG
jgi:hypothetical protein